MLVAAALCATPAMAQGPLQKIEIGAFGQFTKFDDVLQLDDALGVGGRLGISVYKWLGIEGDIQYAKTKANRPPNESITYRPFRGLVTLGIPLADESKVRLILGGGYMNSVYEGRATANEYEDGVTGLVGLAFCTGDKWSIRTDVVGDYNPSPNEQDTTGTSTNLGVRAGLSYAVRGRCRSTPPAWEIVLAPENTSIRRDARGSIALAARQTTGRMAVIALRDVRNLTCTSSDAAVLVDNAGTLATDNAVRVTGARAGNASIRCIGEWKGVPGSDNAAVSVAEIPWTLTIAPRSGTAEVGGTVAFTSSARDEAGADLGAVTWSSSNTAVATVANGTVTCVSAGTSTITVSKTANNTTKSESATVTCTRRPDRSVRLDETLFDFDKATVRPEGVAVLNAVLEALKAEPSLRISVEGHTDKYGRAERNEQLAARRAEAVKTYLTRNGGDAARIFTRGFGEGCLITDAGDPDQDPPRRVSQANKDAQQPNRRVEVWELQTGDNLPTSCRPSDQRSGRVPFGAR